MSSNTTNKSSVNEQINSDSTTHEQCAAVHTRAMVAKESKPPNRYPLKVKSVQGLDIGPDELLAKQKADTSLRKYWELVDKPTKDGKAQFIVKKGILYHKYLGKQDSMI